MTDKKRFAEAIKYTATATEKALDEETIRVYWDILKDYPIDDVEAAFYALARKLKWFPKVAEVIELITPQTPTLDELAVQQWDHVVSMLRDSRYARSDNPVTESVVWAMGGYVFLGRLSMDELKWQQKEFVRRWVAQEGTTVAPIHRRIGRVGQLMDDSA